MPLLITNRHVLTPARDLTLNFLAAVGDEWDRGKQAHWTIRDLKESYWYGHPDVAVLPLADVFDNMTGAGVYPFFRVLTRSVFATAEDFSGWDALQPVTFVGYPAGLYDTVHGTPVARQGVTATHMTLDYEGMPAFMIDAKVFPGSSGSPVFVGGSGMNRLRTGWKLGPVSFSLAGILASVHQVRKHSYITRLTRAQYGVETTQFLDLGIVFRSDSILEAIDGFLSEHGVEEELADVPLPLTD